MADGNVTMSNDDRLDISEIIDFERDPIGELDASGSRAVGRCRAELAEDGACQLDGFIRPVAATRCSKRRKCLSGKAFRTDATNLDADPPYLVFEYIPEGELRDYCRNLQTQGEQVPLRYFFRVAHATGDCPARQLDRLSTGRQRHRTDRSYLTREGSRTRQGATQLPGEPSPPPP